ncbi:hypothetical protein HanRHA438_Chr05g0206581 [Helianthus annuus]|nr:hypothetical protein HanRHA438_Chr05g0206581 [Helianthus annuus]
MELEFRFISERIGFKFSRQHWTTIFCIFFNSIRCTVSCFFIKVVRSVQGLHNLHGSFNVAGTLGSRNPTTANVPSNGLQQQSGNLSAGRFTSNNMPAALSQIAHGNSLSHSGLNSRGSLSVVGTPGFSSGANAFSGSIPGVLPTTVPISNRNSIPGVGVPPVSGNLSSRITSSAGNIGSGGSNGRSLSSGGGLSIPGLASRLNLNTSGSGNLGVQGSNRLMGGMLQQGLPRMLCRCLEIHIIQVDRFLKIMFKTPWEC